MKTKITFTTFLLVFNLCLLTLLPTTTKAQSDPNCGILIDGVIVDKIDCWSYENFAAVFPIKQDWKKYDRITFHFSNQLNKPDPNKAYNYVDQVEKDWSIDEFFERFSDADYALWTIYCTHQGDEKFGLAMKKVYGTVNYNKKDGHANESNEIYFLVVVYGKNITSYKETYYNGSLIKEPIYGNGVPLYSTYIPVQKCFCPYKRSKADKECEECKEDITKQCQLSGKRTNLKIELSDYCGKSHGIKSAVVKTNSTPAKTGNTKTTTTKTTGGNTTTKLADGLVPYVEKHDNGKVSVQGQKDKDENPQGTWKYYDESGKLTKTEVYKDGELISTKEN